jgi:protein-S-isoprenylcysteine O-methyltransferase Ste14
VYLTQGKKSQILWRKWDSQFLLFIVVVVVVVEIHSLSLSLTHTQVMLDKVLARTRPGYAEYMKRTPGFIPGVFWPSSIDKGNSAKE